MTKALKIRIDNLTRMLLYVLSRRPYEFGILPDEEGFVKIKELVKALNQEPGWSHIRESSINEILIHDGGSQFQLKENRIRAVERLWDINECYDIEELPSVLFAPIRRRAHRHVFEKGLSASPNSRIILTPSKVFAKKMGLRRDNEPVVLEILAQKAIKKGIRFFKFGDLYLAEYIPKEYISAPLPPQEYQKEKEKKQKKKEKEVKELSGSFILDAKKFKEYHRPPKGRKKKSWKESSRKLRRRR